MRSRLACMCQRLSNRLLPGGSRTVFCNRNTQATRRTTGRFAWILLEVFPCIALVLAVPQGRRAGVCLMITHVNLLPISILVPLPVVLRQPVPKR